MANQRVGEIMLPFDMTEVSINESAAKASERVLDSGRSAVVEVANHEPFAILSPRSSRRLLNRPGPLSHYYQELTVTGLTVVDYPIERLVESITFDTNIDAFIVMDGKLRSGVVPVRDLFGEMRRMGLSFHPSILNPPNDLCYCCPVQPSGPSHQVRARDANRDPKTDVFCCPVHGDWLIPKQPCTDC